MTAKQVSHDWLYKPHTPGAERDYDLDEGFYYLVDGVMLYWFERTLGEIHVYRADPFNTEIFGEEKKALLANLFLRKAGL